MEIAAVQWLAHRNWAKECEWTRASETWNGERDRVIYSGRAVQEFAYIFHCRWFTSQWHLIITCWNYITEIWIRVNSHCSGVCVTGHPRIKRKLVHGIKRVNEVECKLVQLYHKGGARGTEATAFIRWKYDLTEIGCGSWLPFFSTSEHSQMRVCVGVVEYSKMQTLQWWQSK